jgi:hypothetical protein
VIRRTLRLFVLVLAFCLSSRAFGQCSLSAYAEVTSSDSATYTLHFSASSANGGPVEIFLNGITQKTCPTSPCAGTA